MRHRAVGSVGSWIGRLVEVPIKVALCGVQHIKLLLWVKMVVKLFGSGDGCPSLLYNAEINLECCSKWPLTQLPRL